MTDTSSSTRYPSREQITNLFSNLSNGKPEAFFARISPDVDWELLGQHPLAGRYTNLADWKKGTLEPINKVLKSPLELKVRNVVGGGDQEWALVELTADAVCKNGTFHLSCVPASALLYFIPDGALTTVSSLADSFTAIQAWNIRSDTAGSCVLTTKALL